MGLLKDVADMVEVEIDGRRVWRTAVVEKPAAWCDANGRLQAPRLRPVLKEGERLMENFDGRLIILTHPAT